MEKTVKQRLMEFAKFRKISISKLESLSGLGNGYVGKLKNEPGSKKLDDILRVFPELNREWLLYGEGEMLQQAHQEQQSVVQPIVYTSVPCIMEEVIECDRNCVTCKVRATCPQCGAVLPDEGYTIIPKEISYGSDVVIGEWLAQNRDRAKRINFNRILPPVDIVTQKMHDRSMEPKIVENSFILYKIQPNWQENLRDGYCFDGTVFGIDVARPHLIFRKVYNEGDKLRCVPLNDDFGPIVVDKDKVLGVYEVWAILRLCKETI